MLIQATDIGRHTGQAQKPDWATGYCCLHLVRLQVYCCRGSQSTGVQEGLHKERAVFHLLMVVILQTVLLVMGDSREILKSPPVSFTAAMDPVHKGSVSLSTQLTLLTYEHYMWARLYC